MLLMEMRSLFNNFKMKNTVDAIWTRGVAKHLPGRKTKMKTMTQMTKLD